MKEDGKVTATCKWCGTSLSPTHTGPCPKCGKEGKIIAVEIKETIRLKDSLNWERQREFFERNRTREFLNELFMPRSHNSG